MTILKKDNKVFGVLDGKIFKKKIDENKHLLWSKGGIPALDKDTYEAYKKRFFQIEIATTSGRIFRISREAFEESKQVVDYGWGEQYIVPLEKWEIEIRGRQKLF